MNQVCVHQKNGRRVKVLVGWINPKLGMRIGGKVKIPKLGRAHWIVDSISELHYQIPDSEWQVVPPKRRKHKRNASARTVQG